MFAIRVTTPQGATRTYPFVGHEMTVGRDPSNAVVLEGDGVSGRHCLIVVEGGRCTATDRGSTNGTWVNNRRLEQPTVITEHDRVYVGSYLVQVTMMAAEARPDAAMPSIAPLQGPILRERGADRIWRDKHGQLQRWADRWDEADRPARLTLDPHELREARRWLANTPKDKAMEVSRLQREFIAASEKAATIRMIKTVLLAAAGVVVLAGIGTLAWVLWPEDDGEDVVGTEEGSTGATEPEPEVIVEHTPQDDPDAVVAVIKQEIEHLVIPHETLDDIAKRYGVSVDDIAQWNLLNPDDPDIEGKTLTIKRPKKRPLPQQKVTYEVEPGENWTKLSRRFDIPAARLRAYNPDVDRLEAGKAITVWIDPKPYEPREPRRPIPDFQVDRSAVSIGAPNAGSIENAIQMPESDNYTRRNPYIMWGSAHTIENLQKALATFRQDVDFDGVIVVADISKKSGGHFPPHKSHQAGRDIDIWLPTLKGVYKKKYLGDGRTKERRPEPGEADWYATWGLIRALIKTDVVQNVFLDWSLQGYVYRAAKNMGATEEELDEWIQWPRGPRSSRAIFRHSPAHIHHIHVRFKCAPYETNCKDGPVRP